jgi:Protein of unknown function (DUF4239)
MWGAHESYRGTFARIWSGAGRLIVGKLQGVIATLGAGDQKTKHKSGQCRYHPPAQLYDLLGVRVEMAFWQHPLPREGEINQITANVILLDTLLAKYGEGAQAARVSLRQAVPAIVDRIWSEGQLAQLRSTPFKATAEGESFYQPVQELQPSNDTEHGLKERIMQVTTDLAQERFLLFSHLGSSIPVPFLAVLLLWMVILFAGFSLMAPSNTTTLASLTICALSVSGAIFLILELNEPFSGLMVIPSDPLRNALRALSP